MKDLRTLNLSGAADSEKGRIIQTVSDILSDFKQQLFYSPFKGISPSGLYLPELKMLIGCEPAGKIMPGFSDRSIDVSRVLKKQPEINAAVADYTLNQSNVYRNKTCYLMWIISLLLNEYISCTSDLLDCDKLKNYALRRFRKILLEKNGFPGKNFLRSLSAVTSTGYRILDIPTECRIYLINDPFISASEKFIRTISSAANSAGYDTYTSHAIDVENSPLHLFIPELKMIFISSSPILEGNCKFHEKINLTRFYNTQLLPECEHQAEFYADIIKRFIGETAVNIKICSDLFSQCSRLISPYISKNTSDSIAAEIVYEIINKKQI